MVDEVLCFIIPAIWNNSSIEFSLRPECYWAETSEFTYICWSGSNHNLVSKQAPWVWRMPILASNLVYVNPQFPLQHLKIECGLAMQATKERNTENKVKATRNSWSSLTKMGNTKHSNKKLLPIDSDRQQLSTSTRNRHEYNSTSEIATSEPYHGAAIHFATCLFRMTLA